MFCKLGTLFCLFGIATLANANVVKPTLKGVVFLNAPFVIKNNFNYSGYSADLISMIAKKVEFKYELYNSPDDTYGMLKEDGSWSGMIGEVQNKSADFATGDITITNKRKEAVDFTEPIMDSRLSAIVQKEYLPTGATTLKDLINTNLTFVVLKSGSTAAALKNSNSVLGQTLWKKLSDSNNFVSRNMEGIELAKTSPTVLIAQFDFNEYAAEDGCRLVVLPDDSGLSDIQYGIAMQKNSLWLEPFNEAIKEFQSNGKLDELKKKYWSKSCSV